jgi:outer membrane protein OmpA-like peptidoglycan-associated protein
MKYKNAMRSKIYIIGIALMTFSMAFGQDNLVDNGSFEDQKKNPKRLGSLKSADNWTCPTAVKGDLFTAGKVEEINTPTNVYGTEEAKDGEAYAGIVMFSYGDKMPRSYLMTPLNAPLKKGKEYCIQYSVSLAEGSKYACNQLGAILSKKEFGSESKGSLIEKPSIVSSDIQNAVFGWQKICGTYVADGNEKFITIGNFASNEDTKSEKNKPPKGMKVESVIAAYYYLDEVKVLEMVPGVDCSCGIEKKEVKYSTVIYQKQVILEDKMTPKQKVELQELYFAFGSADLTPLSKEALTAVAKILKDNPAMKLQVNGHSDTEEDRVGEEKTQYSDMSNKRISSVMKFMAAQGVEESRIIPSSQGSSNPNADIRAYDEEEIAQAKNRRVVFKVR